MDAREGSRPLPTPQEEATRRTRRKRAQRKRKEERLASRISQLESENHRLRLIASSALERLEVSSSPDPDGAVSEAEALLRQVVTLDGRYVPRDAPKAERWEIAVPENPWAPPSA